MRLRKKLELLGTGTWLTREQEVRKKFQEVIDDIRKN